MSDTPDRKNFALVPTGSTALTTRSSALVKRGLNTLALQRGRVVRFPPDRSMGSLTLYDSAIDVSLAFLQALDVGEARGEVTVPAGMKLALSISDDAVVDLSPLASLRPDDLQCLSFFTFYWPNKYLEDGDLLQINQLRSLEVLWLTGSGCDHITDVGLQHIGKVTALRELHLGNRNITDAGLICLRSLKQLEKLSLIRCHAITNAGLIHIVSLTTLRDLQLDGTLISGVGLSYLDRLPSLIGLSVSNAEIFDADIAKNIQGLTNLTRLGLEGTCITDNGLKSLRGLTNLQNLDLTYCSITDAGLVHLQNLGALEYLNLSYTNVSHAATISLQEALPNCEIVKWGG